MRPGDVPAARWARLLRWVIVIGWLAVYGGHIATWLGPALGLVAKRDPGAVAEAHLESRYSYRIHTSDGRTVGSLTSSLGLATNEGLFRQDLLISLTDMNVFPAADLILAQLDIPPTSEASASIATTTDHTFRLIELRANGRIGPHTARFIGKVSHIGMQADISIPSMRIEREVRMPAMGLQSSHAAVGLVALPAGLEPGEHFQVTTNIPRLFPPGLEEVEVDYRVGEAAPCPWLDDQDPLLPVSVIRDDTTLAVLWGDQRGVVHAVHSIGLDLYLSLVEASRADDPEPEPASETTTPSEPNGGDGAP